MDTRTIERTALSNLIYNEDYARKVLPFIKGNYFEVREEYEKCAILQQLVEGLENNQQSIGRGRIEPN